MPDIAFVDDIFMPLSQARVSVEDRGYQFGDGVYEVLRTYARNIFRPLEHLARLERSAHALAIPLPYAKDRWLDLLTEAVAQCGYANAKIYLQVTRGVAPREHTFSSPMAPTVVLTVRELIALDDTIVSQGVGVITTPDIRWGRCDIKSICLLPNILAKQKAMESHCFEALFVHDGNVMEGSTSNVFIVKNGHLYTPPESPRLLSGVTRMVILYLAREAGVEVREVCLSAQDLVAADEVFLTGTTIEVLAAVRVNGNPVAAGQPGPLTRLMQSRFRQECA